MLFSFTHLPHFEIGNNGTIKIKKRHKVIKISENWKIRHTNMGWNTI
jgi:hypothetical protein